MATDEGFDDWTQLFKAKMRWGAHQTWFTEHAVNRPVLAPWTLTAHSADRASLDRNPYYHIVDTEGNQLPYVDGLNYELLSDKEVYQIRITAGSLDFGQFELDFNNMPLYRDNEGSGNYRTLISKALRSSALALQPNWTYKDAAVAEIFQELDFRIALSVAIDRDAINDAVFFGLATPFQGTILPSYTFYEDHWGTIHTEFDPAKANELLDAVGLDQRDAEGWRLRPDGERLTLIFEIGDQEGPKDSIAELVAENWRDVGLDTQWNQMERPLYEERLDQLTEIMIGTEHTEAAGYFTRWVPWVWGYKGKRAVWAGGWTRWFATDGAEGAEPPAGDQGQRRVEVRLAAGSARHRGVRRPWSPVLRVAGGAVDGDRHRGACPAAGDHQQPGKELPGRRGEPVVRRWGQLHEALPRVPVVHPGRVIAI